jgi:hypothetical protein
MRAIVIFASLKRSCDQFSIGFASAARSPQAAANYRNRMHSFSSLRKSALAPTLLAKRLSDSA